MKKLFVKSVGFALAFIPLAAILVCAAALWADAPAPFTTVRAIHALSKSEASQGMPVAFEATVTYYRGYENNLFVQDGDTSIYVMAPANLNLVPGDRILVRGKTQDSFNPIVIGSSVTLLHHGERPKPQPASFDQMIRAETDCKLITMRGRVRTADLWSSKVAPVDYIHLQLVMDGGYVDANIDSDNVGALESLLDAQVEVTGVAGEQFDSKMNETGVLLHIQSLSDVRIIERANSNPWSLPVMQMNRVITVAHLQDETPRVRVHGTITYYQVGSAVVLQDGAKSIWIATQTHKNLKIGDEADATGFPDAHDGFINLVHGEVQDTLRSAPVTPLPATWETLTPRGFDSPGHHYDLVSIEGKVVTEVHESSQDEYVLAVDGKQFSAILRHPDGAVQATREIPPGSTVRVTGICVLEYSNPFLSQVPFDILLRSFDDIALVKRPSLLTVRNLIIAVGLLLLIVFAVGARGWFVEHRARAQTSELASIERRRSRILEDINGTRPLAEIIEEITDLVSFRLKGAPCWCQIAGGALLGNCPKNLPAMRMLRQEIPARSGPPLGEIFAAFNPQTKFHSIESESISVATALAALAIETRRLYTDLIRRSEFDLLTDIHNRFSLEKHLDALIEEARQNAGIFGLIYIDLDEFKQVNDVYGHRVGDLYLQEVAMRMKRQLRSHDTLARLGGDEFAVLVSVVRNRAAAEEIAHRLEHCFDEPFSVEGYVLNGSASVGLAIYPEDGSTRDSLLSASDAVMYVSKHTKHKHGRLPADQRGH
ncbi:MAG: GGDEF domain-containing protein [Terracidiphilus sp.]